MIIEFKSALLSKLALWQATTARRLCLILALATLALCLTRPAYATNPPVITPGNGVYAAEQATATITGDPGASFFYTTDGSNPTISSTPYTVPITLGATITLKAIADLSGVLSTVTTANIQSDPATLQVPRTGLQLWLKPEFITVSTGKVTQWSDVSGVSPSNNATQVTSANQPTFVAGSLYGFNGVSLNGTSSYLTMSSFLTNLTSGFSIFAVLNPNTSATAKTLFTSSVTGVQDMTSVQINSTTVTVNSNNGATVGSVVTGSGAVTTGSYQIFDSVNSGAGAATINVNAVNIAVTGTPQSLNNIARPINYIGADNAKTGTAFWGGKIAEILCYSRAVTVSERAQIQAYLANRYQLSNSISTPTPVLSLTTGTLPAPAQVAISAAPNATTYFTTDGTTPTTSSSVYNGPILIYFTETLKALSVANGINSAVATANYTLNSTKWPAPSATDTTSLKINLQLPTTAIPQ